MYHGKHLSDKTALITDSSKVTYGELRKKILSYAAQLSEYGVKNGDRVILAADYSERFVSVYFAVHWLGAVSIVVDRNATELSLSPLLQGLLPELIILNHSDSGGKTYEIFQDTDGSCSKGTFTASAWADILYTTGTTGTPKGVILSHKNEVAGACNVINGGEMEQNDRNLLTMPLHHAFGLTTLRAVLYKGSTAILQDGIASLKKMNQNIRKNRCNSLYLVPAALRILYFQTRQRLDLLLGTLDKIEFCTSPLDKKMRLVLSEQLKGIRLYNSYGATESARTVYMRLDQNTDKLDAIGQAVQNVSVHIVDEAHQVIVSSRNCIGHLAICGDMNMVGYFNDNQATEQVLEDGIFYSEDLGYMDEDGYIYLAGRNNDVMNIGGEKVSPLEIENTALDYEGVSECACIGVEDPEGVRGHVPVLFVVETGNQRFSDSVLKEYLGKYLEHYKMPYRIIEVKEIPKNYVGKIDRKRLSELWQSMNNK